MWLSVILSNTQSLSATRSPSWWLWGSLVGGALASLVHMAYAMHFLLCGPWELYHFFCEVKALLKLSCEDISACEKGVVVTSTVVVLLPISLILTSYTLIFLQVLQMNSPEGRTRPWLLLFPSDCGHILLCQSHANIHEAWIFSHLCSEPGSIYVWHYPHSHAEPPHL